MPTSFGVVAGILIGVLPEYIILVPLALAVPGPTVKASWREIERWRARAGASAVQHVVRPHSVSAYVGLGAAHLRQRIHRDILPVSPSVTVNTAAEVITEYLVAPPGR